jgi:predicted nucleic acid-binding protein
MAVDPSKFFCLNIIDTCAIWNILSSKKLYQATLSANCLFSCTQYVFYESLLKPRSITSEKEIELQSRLKKEIEKNQFKNYHITIEDLQEVEILEKRKNLSKGELSSIVFARKTRQAFLTDDQGARKLAEQVMDRKKVQTTPHLLGWLFYSNYLIDSDKFDIIEEHNSFNRPLEKYFEEIYLKAFECKLAQNIVNSKC